MLQLAFGSRQSLCDLTEAVGSSQLTEQHGNELAPAGEASRVPLGFVLMYRRLKLGARKQLENLAENTAYCTHGGCLSGKEVVFSGTHFNLPEAPPVACSARRSRWQASQKPNLDGCDVNHRRMYLAFVLKQE